MTKTVFEHVFWYCSKINDSVNIILKYDYPESGEKVNLSLDCENKLNCGVYPKTKKTFLNFSWYSCPACKTYNMDIRPNTH